MIELWLFGRLWLTLASATSLVLLLVALTSTTYLSMTLITAMRMASAMRAARAIGMGTAALALGAALAGVRLGALGTGGEAIPTLAVSIAVAAAFGSTTACAWLAGQRASRALGAGRAARAARLVAARKQEALQLEAARRSYRDGDDVRAETARADAAVDRLRAAMGRLERAGVDVATRLGGLDEASAAGDLGRELRRARDDIAAKLELGAKILAAAEVAAFRLACSEPLRRLLRQRPREPAVGIEALEGAAAIARVEGASAEIDMFLAEGRAARYRLEDLEMRRPLGIAPDGDEDPLPPARRDLSAVETAYRAVRDRLEVVRVRISTRADMDEVASAAGEVTAGARASGIDAGELRALVDEVTRAESAILMATPGDYDTAALSDALARGTDALDRSDGASLDDLLRALREIA